METVFKLKFFNKKQGGTPPKKKGGVPGAPRNLKGPETRTRVPLAEGPLCPKGGGPLKRAPKHPWARKPTETPQNTKPKLHRPPQKGTIPTPEPPGGKFPKTEGKKGGGGKGKFSPPARAGKPNPKRGTEGAPGEKAGARGSGPKNPGGATRGRRRGGAARGFRAKGAGEGGNAQGEGEQRGADGKGRGGGAGNGACHGGGRSPPIGI